MSLQHTESVLFMEKDVGPRRMVHKHCGLDILSNDSFPIVKHLSKSTLQLSYDLS